MEVNRVCDPVLSAVEKIKSSPRKAYERMKADQEKVTKLQAELKGLKEKHNKILLIIKQYNEEEFWNERPATVIETIMRALKNNQGSG